MNNDLISLATTIVNIFSKRPHKNTTQKGNQVLFILLSDLPGYSKMNNNHKQAIQKKIELFTDNHKGEFRYINTWGDSFIILSNTIKQLIDVAFKLEYDFAEYKMRIALHCGAVYYQESGGDITQLYGKDLDKTARIEPIVIPKSIWCSHRVLDYISNDDIGSNYQTFFLGDLPLAKNYGREKLYLIKKREDCDFFDFERYKEKIENVA